MQTITAGLVRACRWVTRLAGVNLLWIGFSLLGLGILGVMPATAALFTVLGHWARHDDIATARSVTGCFWQAYRDRFLSANAYGYTLAGLGYQLATNYAILRVRPGASNVALSVVFLTLLIAYTLTAPYAFPVFVHLDLTLPRYFAWSFAHGLGHPVLTILMTAGAAGSIWGMIRWAPLLLPFFGASIPALITTWGTHQALHRSASARRASGAPQPPRGPSTDGLSPAYDAHQHRPR